MSTFKVKYAVARPVPDSYDHCVRTKDEKIDVTLAKKQHAEYCRILQELGLRLVWVEGDNALPDSCFVEDTALVFGEKAVICNMSLESRIREAVGVAKVLKPLKEIYHIKAPAIIDGGDVLRVEGRVFVGLSTRSNLHAVDQLGEILGDSSLEVVPIRIHNVLHLKSACTYLGDNYVILSRGHFDTGVMRHVSKIVVPEGEEYAADCLSINGTILMAKGHPKTKELLEKKGFSIKELDVSEFRKGDGALTCLSITW